MHVVKHFWHWRFKVLLTVCTSSEELWKKSQLHPDLHAHRSHHLQLDLLCSPLSDYPAAVHEICFSNVSELIIFILNWIAVYLWSFFCNFCPSIPVVLCCAVYKSMHIFTLFSFISGLFKLRPAWSIKNKYRLNLADFLSGCSSCLGALVGTWSKRCEFLDCFRNLQNLDLLVTVCRRFSELSESMQLSALLPLFSQSFVCHSWSVNRATSLCKVCLACGFM